MLDDISLFDWLAGGPGATAGSEVRYFAFVVGSVIAIGYGVVMLWGWAAPNSWAAKFQPR